ncbi:prolyl 3-hydroxylase 1-like [Amphiura filiformis]|uniref:prolyl 3-hydroxylase 1-like n=1 Tax=Amphiura filiformis TaxID=82378 RepID=UPI003B219470
MQLIAVMAQLISLCTCIFTLSVTYLLFKSVESELYLDSSELVDERTYDEWFQSGMTAYTNEEWADTIWYFENGIKEFRYYRSSLAYCRIKCLNVTKVAIDNDGLNEQRYFQAIFKKALCIRKCKFDKLGSRPERINQEVTDKYLSQAPYSYLQFAYYKNLDYEKAVAAAYTFVQANPEDEIMYNNLDYYKNLHGISEEHLVDLEEKIHNRNFLDAYSAYEIRNYTGVIVHMESALKNYWMAEEECRAMCEGKYENREFMDLYEAIANHYASTLFCKDQCETWLATIKGKVVEDYLPNHFHFLQFAYFQVGDLEAAVSAAAAFLLIKPGDETMQSNMAYYENQQGVNKYTIRPRMDAHAYKGRLDLETAMLEFAKNEFWGEEDEELPKRDIEKGDGIGKEPIFGGPTKVNLATKNSRGPEEVTPIIDDAWKDDEALPIVEYADGDWGDGEEFDGGGGGDYDGMTEEEKEMDEIELQKFLNEDIDDDEWIGVDGEEEEDMKEEEEKEQDDDDDENDIEHASEDDDEKQELEDNTKYGTTKSEDTSEHSAKDAKDEQKTEQRTSSHDETESKHSILKDDPKVEYKEPEEPQQPGAPSELGDPPSKPSDPGDPPSEPSGPHKSGPAASVRKTRVTPKEGDLDDFVQAPTEPIRIMQDEGDLNGTKRVAADGIASQEECETLMKLIKMEAMGGDGYMDKSTPYVHTKFEVFEGLTVKQATQAAKAGRVSMFYPLTYMHVAERSRQFVEEYFDLAAKGLYFSYTHLVCRTAEPDSTNEREDFSHPIHADNCQLDHYGFCHKQVPAFTWRDWSAITYLNDDFEGGDFIFAFANQTVQSQVRPKCGRVVAFSAGSENLHGVKAVIKGTRCALALWFTHDSRYRELDFFTAAKDISEMYESVYGKEKHDEL